MVLVLVVEHWISRSSTQDCFITRITLEEKINKKPLSAVWSSCMLGMVMAFLTVLNLLHCINICNVNTIYYDTKVFILQFRSYDNNRVKDDSKIL